MGEEEKDTIRRYPGLGPFKKEEQMLFFGRTLEIQELLYSLKVHDIFVLFGISGLGKSSLINAGVLPLLRNEHLQEVEIKFPQVKDDVPDPVFQELEKFVDLNKLKKAPGPDEKQLWLYLNAWKDSGSIPVLIFDQFENFFNYPLSFRTSFISQVAEISRGKIPRNLRESFEKLLETGSLTELLDWIKVPKAKFLFSIRSDKLSLLDELTREIPDILSNRYQLKPLTKTQAKEAIERPAFIGRSNELPFGSDPFDYKAESVDLIIQTLSRRSDDIDTSQLQVICHAIETKVIERQKKDEKEIIINETDFDGMTGLEKIQKEFYNGQMNELKKLFPDVYPRIQVLLEEEFLYKNSTTRLSVLEDEAIDFLSNELMSKENSDIQAKNIIAEMVRLRLIRDEVNVKGRFYEISHDTLVNPILQARAERLKNDQSLIRQKELDEAAGLIKQCFLLFNDEKFSEAIIEVKKAFDILEKYPEEIQQRVEAKILLAKCYESLREFKEARIVLEHSKPIIEKSPKPLLQGQILEALGSIDEEENEFSQAKQHYESALQYYKLAPDYLRFGQLAEHLAGLMESDEYIDPVDQGTIQKKYTEAMDSYKTLKDRIGMKRVEHALERLERLSIGKRKYAYLAELFSGEVHQIELTPDRTFFIGRNTADIRNNLGLKNQFVSRRHISINYDYMIEDLQSMNGSTLNGDILTYGSTKPLNDHDIIVLANTLPLQFLMNNSVAKQAPDDCWGMLILSDNRTFHYLIGDEEYSISLQIIGDKYEALFQEGEQESALIRFKLIENVPSFFAETKMEVFSLGTGNEKDVMGEWRIYTTVKDLERGYKLYILNPGTWYETINFPLSPNLVGIVEDKEEILVYGPTFQLVIRGDINPK